MKPHALALVLASAALPALAQTANQAPASTGVSHPDAATIDASTDDATAAKATPTKPSAAILAQPTATPATTDVYGPYVPYRGSNRVSAAHPIDPDSQIVTSVPEQPGEVREGTLLHVRMLGALSTLTTTPGSRFSAELTAPVENLGRVVLPIGSILEGRITEVHSGRRISGRALIHLEPRSIVLPDGTHYNLHAQLIDSDGLNHTAVDSEGSLVRHDHPKETLAILGATTGTAAVAGGMIGGGVGAVVGAGIGAGASTIVWLKQDRQAELPANARLVFSLTEAMPMRPIEDAANRLADRRPIEPAAPVATTLAATE